MFVTTSLEGDYSNVTAHQSYGIVAGVSKEGAVTLFDEDLQQTLQTLPNTKNSLVNRLCWHPTKKFLLISWSSGMLILKCRRLLIFLFLLNRVSWTVVCRHSRIERSRRQSTFLSHLLYGMESFRKPINNWG